MKSTPTETEKRVLKLRLHHPWKRRQEIRKRVRILKRVDDEYGTAVSWQNLQSARLDLKYALLERWK